MRSPQMDVNDSEGFMKWDVDESEGMSRVTSNAREELILEAKIKAKALGGNAITGLRFQTNTIYDGTIDMVLYGTAVHVRRNEISCDD